MKRLTISLCADCGTQAHQDLTQKLSETDMPDGVRIQKTTCLGPCHKPMVLALQAPKSAGYVFAGITVDDAADIAATARLFLSSEQGWIEDARPCGRLRHLLVARFPA